LSQKSQVQGPVSTGSDLGYFFLIASGLECLWTWKSKFALFVKTLGQIWHAYTCWNRNLFNSLLSKRFQVLKTTVSGCWPLRWRVSSLIDGKVSLHVGQGNEGVSPVCLARCSIKKSSNLKVIEQNSHFRRGSCPNPDPSPPITPASCLFSWTLRWVA
jgi:hypothetical protein